jgi:hypothetical protein
MHRQSIIAVIVIFALIVLGMFTFTYLKQQALETPSQTTEPETSTDNPYNITTIDATHFFIDGQHTVVGQLVMPTPCDLLEVDALVRESFPEQVLLSFNVINTAETCAQVLTEQRFSVGFPASEGAVITAEFMGQPVNLNLIPAPAGALPEEFELFIKG